jgi:hypothetical protein
MSLSYQRAVLCCVGLAELLLKQGDDLFERFVSGPLFFKPLKRVSPQIPVEGLLQKGVLEFGLPWEFQIRILTLNHFPHVRDVDSQFASSSFPEKNISPRGHTHCAQRCLRRGNTLLSLLLGDLRRVR